MAIKRREYIPKNNIYMQKSTLDIGQYYLNEVNETLEYFTIIDKIICHYKDNKLIKEEKIFLKTKPISIGTIDNNSFSKGHKEKSFFENASFFLSTLNTALQTVLIDTKIEEINKYRESLKVYSMAEGICYNENDTYKNMIKKFFQEYPEYKQEKDKFDKLKNEKKEKIELMNNLTSELNKFRQYILDEFNPMILELLHLKKVDESNIKIEYIKVLEKLLQKIEYSFKSTSSKNIINSETLIKLDDLKSNNEILENDNRELDNEIGKILNNEFFKNYTSNEFKDFNTIKSKINTLIKQNKPKKVKKPTVKKDIELENLKKELKSLESKLQELVEQKTEQLNDIEEFNREYNLHLGELIKDILNLKKEILYKQTIKQQNQKVKYQEDIQIFQDTKETITELKSNIEELETALKSIDEDDEKYEELSQAHSELKEELEKLESELELEEEELEKTKEFIEDETIEQEYEEVNSHYKEFESEYEDIKESFENAITLNDEEKKELKSLYKKAARLCHPDIVPDELKEKAHDLMQKLNEAYSKKDISKVKEILLALKNGTNFEVSSETIEDKELLKSKIKEYKENIETIKSEIEDIKEDETYQTIDKIDDWDEYFEDLKSELNAEKEKLEDESREVLEEKEAVVNSDEINKVTTDFEKRKEIIKSENSEYSKYIQNIENINFEKIRRYCNNLVNDNKADDMQKDFAKNGKMYKAFIYSSLEKFINELNNKTIKLYDWNCNQGINSMLLLDYIWEKQLNIEIESSTLIESNSQKLKRAMSNIKSLNKNVILNCYHDIKEINTSKQKNIDTINLHILSNLYTKSSSFTYEYIDKIVSLDSKNVENYFLFSIENKCKDINKLIQEFYDYFEYFDRYNISVETTKIGKFKKYEVIFKVCLNNQTNEEFDEIPF